MPGPGGHHGGPGGPGGHRGGPGGPGFGGGHHRPPMGGGMYPPPMGGGMWHRPPRHSGCCGCLFPVIGVFGAIIAMFVLLF